MIPKPEASEAVLANDHHDAYEHSVGDTQFVIAGETVTTEDGAADDGL